MVPPSPASKPLETIAVKTSTFYCDGGDGALGHPRVFLTMTAQGSVDCPYCARHFVLEVSSKASAH
jgi:uncharacterized Zn-finger protein